MRPIFTNVFIYVQMLNLFGMVAGGRSRQSPAVLVSKCEHLPFAWSSDKLPTPSLFNRGLRSAPDRYPPRALDFAIEPGKHEKCR
jgi:hypothetical protein